MIVRDQIAELVKQALEAAQSSDALPRVDIDDIAVERPQNTEHGDFATSLPLKLARPMRMNPMQIAERIAENLSDGSEGSDLLAVRYGGEARLHQLHPLKRSWLQEQVEAVRASGA